MAAERSHFPAVLEKALEVEGVSRLVPALVLGEVEQVGRLSNIDGLVFFLTSIRSRCALWRGSAR